MRKLFLILAGAAMVATGGIIEATGAVASPSSPKASAASAPVATAASTGPRGPRGFRGFTGPQGPRGLTGPQGPQGPQGAAGAAQGFKFSAIPFTTQGVYNANGLYVQASCTGVTPGQTLTLTAQSTFNHGAIRVVTVSDAGHVTAAQNDQFNNGASLSLNPDGNNESSIEISFVNAFGTVVTIQAATSVGTAIAPCVVWGTLQTA